MLLRGFSSLSTPCKFSLNGHSQKLRHTNIYIYEYQRLKYGKLSHKRTLFTLDLAVASSLLNSTIEIGIWCFPSLLFQSPAANFKSIQDRLDRIISDIR